MWYKVKVFGILERKVLIGIYLYDSLGRVNYWDLMISYFFYCNCVKYIYEKYWINIEEIMKKICFYYNCNYNCIVVLIGKECV